MAKISLLQKIALLTNLHFDFMDINVQKTADGKENVVILALSEPIPYVRGSQEVEYNGVRRPITAEDVAEIKVHENDFTEGFTFDEDTSIGEYNGSDLVLDVSKQGQVWLRKQTFAAGGQQLRQANQNERLAKLFNKAGTTVPETKLTPVDGE